MLKEFLIAVAYGRTGQQQTGTAGFAGMTDGWDMSEAHAGQAGRQPGRTLGDIVLGLWRAKWLMLGVFLPIFGAGLFYATTLETEYTASSRLYVTVSEEYIYRPRVGDPPFNNVPSAEQVIQAELEILRSPIVVERVLRRFGLRQVYPDLAEAYKAAPPHEKEAVFQRGVDDMMADFSSEESPSPQVIATRFSHPDPQRAAEVLNAIIGAYLTFRSEILTVGDAEGFASRRALFEAQLVEAEDAIQAFLSETGISDFEAERASAASLYATVNEELLRVESRARAVRGEIEVVESELARTPAELDLFVEDNTNQSLQALELEREQLLSRYTPESTPVREIDKRIAQVRDYIAAQDGEGGLVRRGPNPNFQQLEARLSALRSEDRALREQVRELRTQRRDIEARQARLNALLPRYQELQRRRSLYADNVRSFAEREIEEATLRELSAAEADNIRVIEPARAPGTGTSLKMPLALLSFLLAGLTALIAGLWSAFSRRGLGTPRSVERASGLPVLATVSRR